VFEVGLRLVHEDGTVRQKARIFALPLCTQNRRSTPSPSQSSIPMIPAPMQH
jgi:hypothetical protein